MHKPHILLTGASGFLGQYVLRALKQKGAIVTATMRKRREGLELADHTLSLTINPDTDWVPHLQNIDAIIHLADGLKIFEKKHPQGQEPDGRALLAATENFAAAARKANINTFLYISSIKAMCGEAHDGILSEATQPNPQTAYGRIKLQSEQNIQAVFAKSNTNLIIIRNPVSYGQGSVGNMRRLLQLAASPYPLPLGGGEARRSMISAFNLADGIATAALFSIAHSSQMAHGAGPDKAHSPAPPPPLPPHGVFLISDGAAKTVGEIINLLRTARGRAGKVFALPNFVWWVLRRLPLIGPAARRLSAPLILTDEHFRNSFQWTPPNKAEDEIRSMALDFTSGRK